MLVVPVVTPRHSQTPWQLLRMWSSVTFCWQRWQKGETARPGGAQKKIVYQLPQKLEAESFHLLELCRSDFTCSILLLVQGPCLSSITGFLLFSTQFLLNELVALFLLPSPAGQLPLCQPSCYPAVWRCDQYITILLLPVFSPHRHLLGSTLSPQVLASDYPVT